MQGAASIAALSSFSRIACAETFPARYVRVIVPFPPGGPNDLIARAVGRRLADLWQQEVVVENKPGAGTQIGAEQLAKSAPDGYTLMVTSDTTGVINPHLYKTLRYDADKDFTPVSGLVSNYQALIAAPSLPVASPLDLITLAKSKPGELNYGTFGLGSSRHLFGEMFQQMANIKLTVVHYSGSAPALKDLMGGHIQLMFTNTSTAAPLAEGKQVKLLGVGSAKRIAQLPNIQTISEGGLPGFISQSWFGLYAPAKTPVDIVRKINGDVQRVLGEPAFRTTFLEPNMFEPMLGSADDFAALIQADRKKWGQIIRDANLHLD